MSKYTLSQIFIYPIKSLGAVHLTASGLTESGLLYDRRFMLVDKNKKFISQRELPTLTLFRCFIDEDNLKVTFDGDEVKIPLSIKNGAGLEVKIWNDKVQTLAASFEISNWFRKHLNKECTLVYLPEDSTRLVDKNYVEANVPVNLSDGYPYLIIGESALIKLNGKLEEPVEMLRFRPNLVFEGGLAHDEDEWNHFRIGNALFRAVKKCSRCQVPTVDLIKGTFGKEPLKTLNSYRRHHNEINFGMNCILEGGREINCGDEIEIIKP